jgi:hypothetical protein
VRIAVSAGVSISCIIIVDRKKDFRKYYIRNKIEPCIKYIDYIENFLEKYKRGCSLHLFTEVNI